MLRTRRLTRTLCLLVTIDNPDTVDLIGTEKASGKIVLTISDHLAWGDEAHLSALQDKINTYLSFIESGEIYQQYPEARGQEIRIEAVMKFAPDKNGLEFLQRAAEIVEIAGFGLSFHVFET